MLWNEFTQFNYYTIYSVRIEKKNLAKSMSVVREAAEAKPVTVSKYTS